MGCGKYGSSLCKKCFLEMPIAEQICPMCGDLSPMGWTHPRCEKEKGMDGLIVIYEYQDKTVRSVIDAIKYDFCKELVREMLKGFRFESGVEFDYLVPVPLYYYRENWRGFNQAEEIALVMRESMKVGVEKMLVRNKNTKQQVTMKNISEREKNVRGVFEINEKFKNMKLKKLKILLIDDVFTSGADMRECTKVLKKAGVETVWGLALAH